MKLITSNLVPFFFFFFPKAAVSQERMGTEDRLGFHKDDCMHLI